MVLIGCCKYAESFDPFLEVFIRLLHLGWYVLQNVEKIIDRGLNHGTIEDSKIAVSLVLRSNPPSVIGLGGFGFDLPTVMLMEVGSLPERQPCIVASTEKED